MKRFFQLLSIATCLTAFSSCGNKNANAEEGLMFTNTFDNQIGWNNNPLIIKGNGHSGNYITKVDSITEFSVGFQAKLTEVSLKPIKKIVAKVWGKLSNLNANAKLVISVEKDGKNIVWQGVEFKPLIKTPNEWTEITTEAKLPVIKESDAVVKVYVWNAGKETVLVDDLSVQFFE